MKRLLSLCRSIAVRGLLILVLPMFAYAQQCSEDTQVARLSPAMMGSVPPAAAGYACDSPTDADKLCEDFQGTSVCGTGESYCRNTWTVNETGGTVVVGAMGGTNSCTDKGTRTVTVSQTNGTTLEDLGLNFVVGTNSRLYLSAMYRFLSGFSNTDYPSIMAVSAGDPTWTTVGDIAAVALTKRLLYQLDGGSFADGITLGARVNAIARAHPDFKTAVGAFLKK